MALIEPDLSESIKVKMTCVVIIPRHNSEIFYPCTRNIPVYSLALRPSRFVFIDRNIMSLGMLKLVNFSTKAGRLGPTIACSRQSECLELTGLEHTPCCTG